MRISVCPLIDIMLFYIDISCLYIDDDAVHNTSVYPAQSEREL